MGGARQRNERRYLSYLSQFVNKQSPVGALLTCFVCCEFSWVVFRASRNLRRHRSVEIFSTAVNPITSKAS